MIQFERMLTTELMDIAAEHLSTEGRNALKARANRIRFWIDSGTTEQRNAVLRINSGEQRGSTAARKGRRA